MDLDNYTTLCFLMELECRSDYADRTRQDASKLPADIMECQLCQTWYPLPTENGVAG